ncbi:hypothetical protein [Singulisphaera sp. PoT]|uniref:hypothetical protein n=1 Tax=Singulisphaera sp. PoT TaxID=3411797 RepID=UPI003BF5A7CA
MMAPYARRSFAAAALILSVAFTGCSNGDSGSIDLKKQADPSATGGEKPRAFSKGDLEER